MKISAAGLQLAISTVTASMISPFIPGRATEANKTMEKSAGINILSGNDTALSIVAISSVTEFLLPMWTRMVITMSLPPKAATTRPVYSGIKIPAAMPLRTGKSTNWPLLKSEVKSKILKYTIWIVTASRM